MRFPVRSAVWLLPFLLTACFHKTTQTQVRPLAPPIEDAPPPKPVPSPTDLPPTVITSPKQPEPADTTTRQQAEEKPQPPIKRHKPMPTPAPAAPSAQQPAPAPPAANTQVASSGAPAVPAIGQLTSGDSADLRRLAQDSIASVERGLSGISRKLNDQEQKTADHIREFLKQAKAALASGDPEGAQTLAAKAKVLVSELNQ